VVPHPDTPSRNILLLNGFALKEPLVKWLSFGKKIVAVLFEPDREKDSRYFSWIGLGVLYFLGIFLWGYFLGWRKVPFDFSDWITINLPRLDAVRDALDYGQIPFHMRDVSSLHGIDRFFALPDVITTPQMILLRFVSLQTFILIDVFIHYSIGFAGLLWFRRKYNLSLLVFGLLVFLFSFNGHILLHYMFGQITWAGYFLFPLFFALMIRFVEETPSWRWVAQVSFLMFYLVLAGSEHHFLWLLMFLGVLSVVEYKKFLWGFAAMLFSGLVSAIRLFPPAFAASDFLSTMGLKSGLFAYADPGKVLDALLWYWVPGVNADFQLPFDYWEITLFVGLLGTAFIIFFGLFLGVWYSLQANSPGRVFRKLFLPALFLFVLSFGQNYDLLRRTGISIFYGERAVTRFIIVPLVLLMIFAAINLQEWLKTRPDKFYLPLLLGSVYIFYQLIDHIMVWQVTNAREAFGKVFGVLSSDLAGNSLNNHADPAYFTALGLGLAVTLLASLFLLWQASRVNLPPSRTALE